MCFHPVSVANKSGGQTAPVSVSLSFFYLEYNYTNKNNCISRLRQTLIVL